MRDHGQAEAGGLGDPDAAGNHRAKHELGEVIAKLALDVLGELGPLVVHGDHDAGQNQARVELLAQQANGVQELHQALERQVLGLHRNDHAVRGHQGVHGHRAERRRAVEQGEPEPLPDRARACAQVLLGALDPRQLDRGARQVAVRRNDPEVVGARGPRRLGDRALADQAVVGGGAKLAPQTQGDGRVALRVEVAEQHLGALGRGAGGEVDGGRRLADAALLVGDRVHDAHSRATLPTASDDSPQRRPRGRFFAIPGRRGRSVRGRAALAHHVQVAMPGAGVRAHRSDLASFHRQARGGAFQLCLLVRVTAALPGDQNAALGQQRRRQLGQRSTGAPPHGPRRRRSSRARPRAAAWPPSSRSARRRPGHCRSPPARSPGGRTRTCARSTRSGRRGFLASATASGRPGKPAPAPRSAMRRAARSASTSSPLSESATWTRHAPFGVTYGGRRRALGGQQRQDRAQRLARLVGELVGGARLRAQSLSRGATITQRSGSSPSLKVSSPARSLRCWWTTRRSLGVIGSSSISLPVFSARSAARSACSLDRRLAALPVTGGVDHHPLPLLDPAKRRPVAEQLHRVDRLATAPDQKAHVLPIHPADDPLGVLVDLDLAVDLERVDDPLEDRPHPLGGLGRQAVVAVAGHGASR